MLVSKISENKYVYPIENRPIEYSAVLYWAIQRFNKHGIDHDISKKDFSVMTSKYESKVMATVGDDWERQQKYIDWFLDSSNIFIQMTTRYGFDCLCSQVAKNMYFGYISSPSQTMIITDEDRKNY